MTHPPAPLAWPPMLIPVVTLIEQITNRLDTHPCIVTVTEMGAARHFLRTTLADKSEEERWRILQPTLEINPRHAIIRKLAVLKNTDADLARLVAEQVIHYSGVFINKEKVHPRYPRTRYGSSTYTIIKRYFVRITQYLWISKLYLCVSVRWCFIELVS